MGNNALENIVENKKMPVLFVGSGISKRYLYRYPTWDELLIQSFNYIDPNGFLYEKYKDILSRQNLTPFEVNAQLGSYAEEEFNRAYFDKKIDLKVGNAKNPNWLKNGISPYKMYLSQLFKKKNIYRNPQRQQELSKFRALKNKVSAVITTNYDSFLEKEVFNSDYTVFVKQNELFSADSYNIAEIYKIHGCINDANSIVITKHDYDNFEKSRKLIIAKMLTLFTESPLIFLGYSFTDENIRNIIADFIECLDDEQLNNIAQHFVFISYEHKQYDLIESKATIVTQKGTLIPITQIHTDNFEAVYDILNRIVPGVSPLKIRSTRRIVKRIVDQSISSPEAESIIIGLDKLDDLDLSGKPIAIAVGYKENILNKYGYGLLSDEFIIEDIIFDNKQFEAIEMCQERFKSIPKTRLLPVFKYVKAAQGIGFSPTPASKLQIYIELHDTTEKIITNKIKKGLKNLPEISDYDGLCKNIQDIDTLHKKAGLLLKNIHALGKDEIRNTLKELFRLNKDDAMKSTHFKRCVMYLDLIENWE